MAKQFAGLGATICDTSADLPSPAASLEGLLYFQKDTNELKICDGSSWISMLDTDVPPAMQLIKPTSVTNATLSGSKVSFTNVTSLKINGCFTSQFDHYRVICKFTNSATIGNPIYWQFTVNGTPNSSANYYYGGTYSRVSPPGANPYTGVATTAFHMTSLLGDRDMFIADVLQPATGGTTNISWNAWFDDSSSQLGASVNGALLVAGPFDGFQLYSSTTQNFSGYIRIYGYRN